MSGYALVATVLAFVAATPALAADTGIAGQKVVLEVRGTKHKLVLASKDPLTPFPPIGSADDPSVVGAAIDLITPGAAGSLAIPGGTGKPGWSVKDGSVDSYTYKNGSAPGGPSSVRSLALRQGRTLKVSGRNVPIAMTAPLGSLGIRITMGATRLCALFDASTIVADVPGKFTARASLAPADCASSTLGGQEEPGLCGDGQRDPGEECDGTEFPSSDTPAACSSQDGAVPACQADCTCCATSLCREGIFQPQSECCPGLACPPSNGPNDRAYCRPSCQTADDCDAGQVCFLGFCATPYCTADSQCGSGTVCNDGFCCYLGPGRPYCSF